MLNLGILVYHLESRWRNSHLLVYHGPLTNRHLLGVASHLLWLLCSMNSTEFSSQLLNLHATLHLVATAFFFLHRPLLSCHDMFSISKSANPNKKGSSRCLPGWKIHRLNVAISKSGWWNFKYFRNLHPKLWEKMIQFDEHLFQIGGSTTN